VREVTDAVIRSDYDRVISALDAALSADALPRAIRAVGRLSPPSVDFCHSFLWFWSHHGDSFRGDVKDDLALINFLRILLPPYDGPGLALYRGDSAMNRRRRTYGLSWSADREVARSLGLGPGADARAAAHRRRRSSAPPHHIDNSYAEASR
jgi:hypothetical protein